MRDGGVSLARCAEFNRIGVTRHLNRSAVTSPITRKHDKHILAAIANCRAVSTLRSGSRKTVSCASPFGPMSAPGTIRYRCVFAPARRAVRLSSARPGGDGHPGIGLIKQIALNLFSLSRCAHIFLVLLPQIRVKARHVGKPQPHRTAIRFRFG